MNTENQTLRLSLAAFAAILIHTLIVILFHWLDLPMIEIKEKTIPFTLISPSSSTTAAKTSTLSAEDNARAAQEYLSTLNKSQREITRTNRKTPPSSNTMTPSRLPQDTPNYQRKTQSNAISDLQGIFSRETQTTETTDIKQVSSKELEQLSDYEIILLKALAKESLYDPFHEVMNANKRKEVNYSITLNLFANGAIKSASIKKPSGLKQIDELAIQAAYLASPYPTPPREDIQRGYKYHIPIIYKKKKTRGSSH